jgi:hypothetical protein
MTSVDIACATTVSELHQPVLNVVSDDVPDDALSIDQLGSRIVGMAGRLASAMCRWLLLVADFDARDGAAEVCLPSTARWLSHYCGLSARTAREHVRAARVLAVHRCLAEAMGAGRISYSHVRAIARVAELGDERLVADLVMLAEHGTVGQLEDMVRGLRTVDENSQDAKDSRLESVSHRWREDSRLGLSAKLDPERGALVLSAVDALTRREGITQAEALARMAEITIAALNSDDAPAPSLRGDEYAAIVVHLDAAAVPPPEVNAESRPVLEGGPAEPPAEVADVPDIAGVAGVAYARIAGGPGLPDATIKRLLCSGRIRAIVTTDDEGEPPSGRYAWRAGVLDIGANRRLVSDKQFRALLLRDGGCCTVPGCESPIGLEAHHVQHWFWGGKTVLANLILLCRAHHHALHEDAFTVVALGKGRFRFQRADGCELPQHADPSELRTTDAAIEHEHQHVASGAATTRWDGSRLDHAYAVAAFAQGLSSTAQGLNSTTQRCA